MKRWLVNKMDNIFSPNQRIIILQGLYNDNDYSLSNEMLQRLLRQYGHGVSLNHVNDQLSFLEKKKLVKLESVQNLTIAKLTRSGIDVATGALRVEGVDRPLVDD